MLNSFKIYLALCLIGLQLIGPFIHAHAFGLDTLNERAVHIHSNITPHADSDRLMDASPEQTAGFVVTVASGIAQQNADDLLLNPILSIAVFLSFALLLVLQFTRFSYPPIKPLFRKRLIYNLSNPRAPPR